MSVVFVIILITFEKKKLDTQNLKLLNIVIIKY